jgi:TonB-dependent starch-binding outer membrane protein SusC
MNRRPFLQTKWGLVGLFLFFAAAGLFAQKLSGTVSDANGPIVGANVFVKGTTQGAATDIDGNFSFDYKGGGGSLVVSAIGYTTQEVPIGSETSFKVTLSEDVSTLGEVVITGYGNADNKRQTTGAVSTVRPRDLQAVPSGNVEQQLQGRVSGVTVITNGQPGTNSIIRVRGFGAFGGNEPLYIVDGLPVPSTDFLAPDDIETTTVLKDAAAASIYGARAANGVIVYTTKRGKKGDKKVKVQYEGLYGSTSPGPGLPSLNPQEFAEWTWIAQRNSGTKPSHPQFGSGDQPVIPAFLKIGSANGQPASAFNDAVERLKYNDDYRKGPIYLVIPSNPAGTDWWKETTQNAPMMRHNLGFSGASENARYYISFGLQDQLGILKNNSFKRYHFRANSEFDVTKFLRIGQNLQFTYRQVLGQQGGSGGQGVSESESDILAIFRMPQVIPVLNTYGGYAGTAAGGFNNPRNPVAIRDRIADNRQFQGNAFGNVYAELDVLPGLTFRSSLGGQYFNNYGFGYNRPNYENSENNAAFSYFENSSYRLDYTATNTLNYNKTFGKHNINVLAGIEALKFGKGKGFNGTGQEPFSYDPIFVTLSTAVTSRLVDGFQNPGISFFSTFGRLNYSYNDKYYLTGVVRRDGSSRFGANNRYGVFPAFSAAWRVTGEEFMKGLNFLSDLKIRGGYGTMGNSNNVLATNQFTLYSGDLGQGSYPITGSNSSAANGFFQASIGNPDAKWETAITSNIGFDASFLDGKLEVILDLWKKTTKDLLYQRPLPAVTAQVAQAPFVNIASMLNQGLDIQVTYKGKIKSDLSYDATLTGSWLKNEITELAPGVPYFDAGGARLATPPVRNQPGYALSSFFGYKVLGLFQNAAEVASSPTQPGAAPGRFKYADLNSRDAKGQIISGVPDGKIDDADRTVLGNPVPDFTGGLALELKYKNFGLTTYLYTSLGNEIFNQSKWYTDFYASFTGSNLSTRIKDSWSPTNTGATIPIAENVSNFSTNTQSNSYYVENGSYLRMQNLGIFYNVPTKYTGNIFKNLKITLATNNVFTITKYQGLDPQVGGAADTLFGIDIGNYPVTRSIMLALSAGF